MINIDADFGPMTEALDITEAIARVTASNRVMSKMAIAAAISTGSGFNMWADQEAREYPRGLHHVYEWGQTGQPSGRLWNLIMAGRGNSRILNYIFIPSRTFVPAGEKYTGIKGDTRKRQHIFRWKAAVMESGGTVTVNRRGAKFLAFPSGSGMMFRTGPWEVDPGEHTRGNFTDLWLTYFAMPAQVVLNEDVVKPAERWFRDDAQRRLYSKVSKSKPVTNPMRPGVTVKTKAKTNRKPHARIAVEAMANQQVVKARAKASGTGTVI